MRHASYLLSQRKRKLIEQAFCLKSVAGRQHVQVLDRLERGELTVSEALEALMREKLVKLAKRASAL